MNIFLASDSFKGSLPSQEVHSIIEKSLLKWLPTINCTSIALGDGGEGTLHSLVEGVQGDYKVIQTQNAVSQPIQAKYGLLNKGKTAIIELAQASGIAQLSSSKKNALYTSTYGTGILIKDALQEGVEELVLTLGGSATNDMGCGILASLGLEFYDFDGQRFIPTAINLKDVANIEDKNLISIPTHIKFKIACDVKNPLLGKNGATHVFGPQKGLSTSVIQQVEEGMTYLAQLFHKKTGKDTKDNVGSGAAGGVLAGISSFYQVEVVAGVSLLNQYLGIDDHIRKSDLVLTGEGAFDEQSCQGKLVGELIKKCEENKIPLIIVCGQQKTELDMSVPSVVIPIQDKSLTLEENISKARQLLRQATEHYVFPFIKDLIKQKSV